jgi:peptidoglycan/xylan/chitin deacetylase (PgdA/CDA1 family)
LHSRIVPSPFHSLLCAYAIFAFLAAPLVFLAPPGSGWTGADRGEIGTEFLAEIRPSPARDVITTASIEAAVPQCAPDLSLAGRDMVIDPANAPHFGALQFAEGLPLEQKEVVLTFDDGPHPERTSAILDILDRYCVKAVFFPVGVMALEHPDVLREVARRGHVIGAHSFSHPRSLARLRSARAKAEIEMGFAAVSRALGGPVAPLFRFPGFNQSRALLSYAAERGLSVWSVDVVSGDSESARAERLPEVLFSRLEEKGRGMILFHDTKKATVEKLPGILQRLKETGYSAPRLSVTASFMPEDPQVARSEPPKPRLRGLVHRVSGRSDSAPAGSRWSGRLRHARPAWSEFQEQ